MTRPGPVRLVFDTSAIVAFGRGSRQVGAALAEVAGAHGVVALPLACLVEAVHAVAEPDRLDLLVGHPATAVKSDDPRLWRALATTYEIVGRADAAAAALAATDHRVRILTGQPGLYAGLAEDLATPIDD